MDVRVPFELAANWRTILRRAGYAELRDFNRAEVSYVKRLTGASYPRLHVYINERDGAQYFSLHLDQKKPSYAGSHAHNADYDGPTVAKAAATLEGLLVAELHNQRQRSLAPIKKEGFLARLFHP